MLITFASLSPSQSRSLPALICSGNMRVCLVQTNSFETCSNSTTCFPLHTSRVGTLTSALYRPSTSVVSLTKRDRPSGGFECQESAWVIWSYFITHSHNCFSLIHDLSPLTPAAAERVDSSERGCRKSSEHAHRYCSV